MPPQDPSLRNAGGLAERCTDQPWFDRESLWRFSEIMAFPSAEDTKNQSFKKEVDLKSASESLLVASEHYRPRAVSCGMFRGSVTFISNRQPWLARVLT